MTDGLTSCASGSETPGTNGSFFALSTKVGKATWRNHGFDEARVQ